MMGKSQRAVEQYLNEVLGNITPVSLKEEIAKEIQCHLTERIQEGVQFRLTEEQAIESAIQKNGKDVRVGEGPQAKSLDLWLLFRRVTCPGVYEGWSFQ